jgi:hypothetical protein
MPETAYTKPIRRDSGHGEHVVRHPPPSRITTGIPAVRFLTVGWPDREPRAGDSARGGETAALPGTRWGVAAVRSDGLGVVERGHVAAVALAVDLEAELVERAGGWR